MIFTLLWLPFGKFFHVFQRPAQLGVSFYKDAGERGEQARCRRCGSAFASRDDGARPRSTVERQLGFQLRDAGTARTTISSLPECRRALFGLAQGALWHRRTARARTGDERSMATIPVDELDIIERFGPHLSSMTGARLSTERRARAAGQDALLLLRPAVRHSAEGAGQRGHRLRAVGGVPVQPRHAVPEGRQALPAGLASRSAAHRASARPVGGRRLQPDAVRPGDRAGRVGDRAPPERRTATAPSACSAARA